MGVRVSTNAQAATYRTTHFEGEYQGVGVVVAWESPWIALRLEMPMFRLMRNGFEQRGPGDLLVALEAPVTRFDERTQVGLGLAVTAPTGSAGRDLGMGHFMAMPHGWALFSNDTAFAQAALGYGFALAAGSGAHDHHGGGPRPIVNPMNASEVELAMTVGRQLAGPVRARTGMSGAVPIAASEGAARATGFIGIDLVGDDVRWSVEGHAPFVGDPFLAKIRTELSVAF